MNKTYDILVALGRNMKLEFSVIEMGTYRIVSRHKTASAAAKALRKLNSN